MGRTVIIAALGRSGSNWLLKSLDLSFSTFCRYDWRLAYDPSEWERISLDTNFAPDCTSNSHKQLLSTLEFLSEQQGKGDKPPRVNKEYYKIPWLYNYLFSLRRRRVLLRLFHPFSTLPESKTWSTKTHLIDSQALQKSTKVFKWIPSIPLLKEIASINHDIKVVHLIRNPAGYIQSWKTRYAAFQDSEEHLAINRAFIASMANAKLEWREYLLEQGPTMSLVESELWKYRYVNESVMQLFKDSSLYRVITYEQLVTQPIDTLMNLYEFSGLEWSKETENKVLNDAKDPSEVVDSWKSKLTDEEIRHVDSVLESSPLLKMWKNP